MQQQQTNKQRNKQTNKNQTGKNKANNIYTAIQLYRIYIL